MIRNNFLCYLFSVNMQTNFHGLWAFEFLASCPVTQGKLFLWKLDQPTLHLAILNSNACMLIQWTSALLKGKKTSNGLVVWNIHEHIICWTKVRIFGGCIGCQTLTNAGLIISAFLDRKMCIRGQPAMSVFWALVKNGNKKIVLLLIIMLIIIIIIIIIIIVY